MKTKQIRTRLKLENFEQIEKISKDRNISRDALMNSAIDKFLNDVKLEGVDTVLERIGGIESKLKALRSDIEISSELLSFFIQYWFTYTPALPESELDVLTLQGFKRHSEFLAQLSRKLGVEKNVLEKVVGIDD